MDNARFMKSVRLSVILEIIVILMMITAAILMVVLPFMLNAILEYTGREEVYNIGNNKNILLFCLYPVMVCAIVILEAVRKIFHVVKNGTPFCRTVPKRLNVISVCILLAALCGAVKFIFIPGVLTALGIAACIIVSLCAFVMAEVYEKAIEIKNENDLTI